MNEIIKLLPHQIDSVKYLEQRCINQKGLLVYHYLGTGKTITGLVWLDFVEKNYSGDYLIVCPELIKSSWILNAKKLKINLIPSKIIDYNDLKLMIETNSKKIKNKYLILDEAHNIVPIITDLITSKKYYLEINSYLTSTKKNLLLSGTPFNNILDLSVLINLCTDQPFMPIDYLTFLDHYGKNDSVSKNKKNPIYFNYVKPLIYNSSSFLFESLIEPATLAAIGYKPDIIDLCWKFTLIPIKRLIVDKINLEKYIVLIEKLIGRNYTVRKIINFFSNKDLSSSVKIKDSDSNTDKNKYETIKKYFIIGLKLLLSFIIWKIIYFLWDKLIENFEGPSKEIRWIDYQNNLNFSKIIDKTKRYISFYKYQNNSDYAELIEINKPMITVLSIRSIILTIEYYLGKLSLQLIAFISQRPLEDIKLDKSLINNYRGFETYGRCLSNLPDFIDKILTITEKFKINKNTGVVSLNNIDNQEIISKSSTKIQNLGDYLVKINGAKKIVIYSEFIEQGAYLLSSYLNSRKINHLYLNKSLTLTNRNTLLDIFNRDNEYTIIIIDKDSKEGISLLNIQEVHFLEPPVDSLVKDQVIGRAIRYQSHQYLEPDKRIVKIYTHISSLFESTSEKLSLLEKIKSKKITDIFFNFITDIHKNYKDDWKIKSLIHKVKKDHFKGQLQTTFHHYLDKILNLELTKSVQGRKLYGKRKYKNDDEIIENDIKVALSIDEQCYQDTLYQDYYSAEIIKKLKNVSVISPNFKILKKYNCIENDLPIKINFKEEKSQKLINNKRSSNKKSIKKKI